MAIPTNHSLTLLWARWSLVSLVALSFDVCLAATPTLSLLYTIDARPPTTPEVTR